MSKKTSRLLTFDCKVCEHCLKPMTAKQYWTHNCLKGEENIMAKDKLEQAKDDAFEILQEELENTRYELDDLLLEDEQLQDKIREKEAEIADLEDRLSELEQDEDASN